MSGAIIGATVALVAFFLGWWGLNNGAGLVPASASAARREREERAIRRGARSLMAMAGLFAVMAALSLVTALADHPTP
ncbi:hypothetical protein [Nocardioides cavernaquae]|uniref:Uncharacterized protein n=1 Tax=Nocardioides cavernaquae TaxID=2321396 RepID=A0A3A5H7V1_9ACTN|nr:hypothetical protein [Nocardioides cavernaquae]RJS46739.1 hypothetical protein D4739_11280 [Nocardioides cavernaquae]